ncbi:hypothetical protein [Bradyrhizobium australiense]|uniref:Uncharacterized protein n=1 Tax=Bradyrhizobium australiense TaxID=2721161 RepID=A0A7Y4GT47_9BRAD|nr:hypothetical protein [Bradyrhizobium australiense]NOJ41376.1 hypothetical protein [Bradyrhizobium australiense]
MSVSKIARTIVSGFLLTGVVIVPPLLSYYGKEPTALLTLVCLLIALLALNVNVDQLEQIGLGPLSAKLRAKIAQADELNDRLKKAIELTLSFAVSGAMRSGRFAGKDRSYQKKIVSDVDLIVASSGLNPNQRNNVLKDFFYFTEFDMRSAFVGSLIHSGSETDPLAKQIRRIELSPNDALPAIKRLAELYDCQSSDWQEWLRDYEHFVRTNELRRPDIWFTFHAPAEGLIRQLSIKSGKS